MHDFVSLVDHLYYGFSVSLSPNDYLDIYKAKALPRRKRKDSQYGLCFRVAIIAAIRFMSQVRKNEWPLTVVLEGGHRNCGDAVRIFNEIKGGLMRDGIDVLGPIAVELKKKCLPLSAADFLVHTIFSSKTSGVPIPETKQLTGITINQSVDRVRPGRAAIQHFVLTRESLESAADILLS
jgi:hypothetical protein